MNKILLKPISFIDDALGDFSGAIEEMSRKFIVELEIAAITNRGDNDA